MRSLSIGESLIDIFMEPDGDKFLHAVGGAPLNYAVNYSCFNNNQSSLLTDFGDDEHGLKIKNFLDQYQVETKLLSQNSFTTKAVVKNNLHQGVEFKFIHTQEPVVFNDIDVNRVANFDVINFVSAFYLVNDNLYQNVYQPFLQAAVDHKKIIVFDPNLRDNVWENSTAVFNKFCNFLKVADIIKLKDEDISFLTEQSEILRQDFNLFNIIKPNAIVINTNSDKGVTIIWNQQQEKITNVPLARIQDATGAGDIFLSAFVTEIFSKTLDLKVIQAAVNNAWKYLSKSLQSHGALGFLEGNSWTDSKVQF